MCFMQLHIILFCDTKPLNLIRKLKESKLVHYSNIFHHLWFHLFHLFSSFFVITINNGMLK